jgi:hypothetical protein
LWVTIKGIIAECAVHYTSLLYIVQIFIRLTVSTFGSLNIENRRLLWAFNATPTIVLCKSLSVDCHYIVDGIVAKNPIICIEIGLKYSGANINAFLAVGSEYVIHTIQKEELFSGI